MNLDQQLRRHDPAQHLTEDLALSPQAAATFAEVTSTPPGRQARASKRKRRTRYSLAAVLAAVVVVAAPVFGGSNAAIADWTAKPEPMTAAEWAHWEKACNSWPGQEYEARIVESRGEHFGMAYLVSADGLREVTCLATDERPLPANFEGSGQSISGPVTPMPSSADGLATNSVMSVDLFAGVQYVATGRVGGDVAAVSFDAGGVYIEATLMDGFFAAWWPERRPKTLLGQLLENGPPNPDVKITLKDGTSRVEPIQDFDVSPM
ncbi:hypothetical protein Kisp01_04690 [Kineosporia sp. NBRC 101677]|uniref:hypothetical protein n=1 Tax=Kineosporia sp. NBRC 101677 TaxID=3032197 RepID=UPI0024A37136|nr:hypothetical protein [Kineosporia sp. NBRC 101677]GLY13453.1 hypothetical protein Kisp01_04690 [Kineosporia sp. NBRC 101677]